MHTFILSDYVTINGVSSGTFTQNESGWLDLTPYEDLVFTVEVKQVTGGTITLDFQTSVTKDEALFTNMITGLGFTAAGAPSIAFPKALMSGATVPVARFVRYKLTGPAAAWNMTFRIYVAANSPGM